MKKIIFVFLLAAILLTGCVNSDKPTEPSATAVPTEPTAPPVTAPQQDDLIDNVPPTYENMYSVALPISTEHQYAEDGTIIRRRRECIKCTKRFTTYEIIESVPIVVVKKDKSREMFDREKLLNGLLRACEKRPISLQQMEKVADEIEAELYHAMVKEVSSTEIGERVMEKLKELDEVAYVRFASVYRQFKDINTFMSELSKLLSKD